MKKILFFFFLFFSYSVFADSYSAPNGYSSGGGAPQFDGMGACADWNSSLYYADMREGPYYYQSVSDTSGKCWKQYGSSTIDAWVTIAPFCPGGGTLSGSSCNDAPACSGAQIRDAQGMCQNPVCISPQINDFITGACITPYNEKPHCVIPQDPLKADCKWPDDQGTGLSCMDGTTVYPPMVCEASFWDRYKTPGPGESSTCPDGSVSNPEQSCFVKYLKELVSDQPQTPAWWQAYFGHVYFGAGTLPTIGPGTALPAASSLNLVGNEVRALFPMEVKNAAGISSYFNVESTLDNTALGQSLSNFIKSNPTDPYVSDFVSKIYDLGVPLTFDSNTGTFTTQGSTVPLTTNQIADVAIELMNDHPVTTLHPTAVTPLPLPIQQLTPYVTPDIMPWMNPGLDALQNDFMAVYNPTGTKPAANFPQVEPSSPKLSPVYSPASEPLVSFTPQPVTYAVPVVTASTLPNPRSNPTPDGTISITSTPTATPAPGTVNDPMEPAPLPDPSTVYPDTWQYFDFLKIPNPFSWDIKQFIPQLPEPVCTYEIHQAFHVPLLGTKHFDLMPCVPLQPMRSVLAWVFYVITGFTCFIVVFRSNL
jgi:hypothetical protein